MIAPRQRFLLITIGVLMVVWWVTRPDGPLEFSSPTDSASVSQPAGAAGPESEGTSGEAERGGEPGWLSNIDDTREECREMRRELVDAAAHGELPNIFYIGDCDVRLNQGMP